MMLFFSFGHDEYVVKVNGHFSQRDEVFKNVVHHPLEGGWRIS